ncbi:Re/Si-specific NAD(P)(+) transhydrogenase subunit alpha [Tistrella mobilis]|uniref:Re/Si-specific NAD(P)(+) transhydrogenase subunit alpha n=1 Tax=Tistrella mobilis TaxID=171437 RepID=UPI0035581216
MKIAVPRETRAHEKRVAATPETVKKYRDLGFEVVVEAGAGLGAAITDDAFKAAGAEIAADAAATLAGADLVLKVQAPDEAETAALPKGATLVAMLSPYTNRDLVKRLAAAGVTAFAMELVPRITRAQSMDVLSSQSNLAGYRAVIDAAAEFGRAMPMMMTAAGTVPPARVLVLGAGVAGLQAIATARRLGGVVSAFDVRPAVKEQVESLGASFVDVPNDEAASAETKGGYAREMSDAYKARQAQVLADHVKKNDMVITTAQIPGKPAPVLITEEMVAAMKPGSVIVDLASETGGNCALTRHGEVVETPGGVRIVAFPNVPARVAVNAAQLYAKNLLTFVTLMVDKETKALKVDTADEIIAGTLLTQGGAVVHPNFKEAE